MTTEDGKTLRGDGALAAVFAELKAVEAMKAEGPRTLSKNK